MPINLTTVILLFFSLLVEISCSSCDETVDNQFMINGWCIRIFIPDTENMDRIHCLTTVEKTDLFCKEQGRVILPEVPFRVHSIHSNQELEKIGEIIGNNSFTSGNAFLGALKVNDIWVALDGSTISIEKEIWGSQNNEHLGYQFFQGNNSVLSISNEEAFWNTDLSSNHVDFAICSYPLEDTSPYIYSDGATINSYNIFKSLNLYDHKFECIETECNKNIFVQPIVNLGNDSSPFWQYSSNQHYCLHGWSGENCDLLHYLTDQCSYAGQILGDICSCQDYYHNSKCQEYYDSTVAGKLDPKFSQITVPLKMIFNDDIDESTLELPYGACKRFSLSSFEVDEGVIVENTIDLCKVFSCKFKEIVEEGTTSFFEGEKHVNELILTIKDTKEAKEFVSYVTSSKYQTSGGHLSSDNAFLLYFATIIDEEELIIGGEALHEFPIEIQFENNAFNDLILSILPYLGIGAIVGIFVVIISVSLLVSFVVWIFLEIKKKKQFKGNILTRVFKGKEKYECQDTISSISMIETRKESDDFAKIKINQKLFEVDINKIKILNAIGTGGSMSTVFLAEWDNQKCAFKCFQTKFLCDTQNTFDAFEREVEVMSSIHHPLCVTFYGASIQPPRVGILMEFCPNGDLQSWILNKQKMDEQIDLKQKLKFCFQITNALIYLHGINVIHRDLKPGNVLLDKQMNCKLMDFGLSRQFLGVNDDPNKTVKIGTRVFMAPEILTDSFYSYKVDMFSLAITFFVILTCNFKPYGSCNRFKDSEGIEVKVANGLRPNINLSEFKRVEFMISLIKNLWNGDPEKRFSATEVVEKMKERMTKEQLEYVLKN